MVGHRIGAGRLAIVVAILAVATLLDGAGTAVAQSPDDGASAEPTRLTVGLGFIPSVQFAQFYLADQAGYYEDAGLEVDFQNKIDPELITLIGLGSVDIGMGDGTSVIPAVSQGIPIVYAATIFARNPNVIFAPVESGIKTVADMEGRSVGIPGRFGSSWVTLQALLASGGLTPEDVEIVTYPDFGQAVAVAAGQVDAATGFINNEPVQLALQGIAVDVLRTDEVAPLPGPGLVVGTSALEAKSDELRAFTAATLRAMQEIAADPQLGLDATFARVPELGSEPETQRAILEATIEAWTSDYTAEHGTGSIDRATWQSALDFMATLPDSVVAESLSVDRLVTDGLLP